MLQNPTQVSYISFEISFITAMGLGAVQIPDAFQKAPWGYLFHSFSWWQKQVGELQTALSARLIYTADERAPWGLWNAAAKILPGSF